MARFKNRLQYLNISLNKQHKTVYPILFLKRDFHRFGLVKDSHIVKNILVSSALFIFYHCQTQEVMFTAFFLLHKMY